MTEEDISVCAVSKELLLGQWRMGVQTELSKFFVAELMHHIGRWLCVDRGEYQTLHIFFYL